MANKTFLNCAAKAKTFSNGGSVINLGVKAADLIAFAERHRNERGYLNLCISERREPGKHGETHSVYLDDYTPKAKAPSGNYKDSGVGRNIADDVPW